MNELDVGFPKIVKITRRRDVFVWIQDVLRLVLMETSYLR